MPNSPMSPAPHDLGRTPTANTPGDGRSRGPQRTAQRAELPRLLGKGEVWCSSAVAGTRQGGPVVHFDPAHPHGSPIRQSSPSSGSGRSVLATDPGNRRAPPRRGSRARCAGATRRPRRCPRRARTEVAAGGPRCTRPAAGDGRSAAPHVWSGSGGRGWRPTSRGDVAGGGTGTPKPFPGRHRHDGAWADRMPPCKGDGGAGAGPGARPPRREEGRTASTRAARRVPGGSTTGRCRRCQQRAAGADQSRCKSRGGLASPQTRRDRLARRGDRERLRLEHVEVPPG